MTKQLILDSFDLLSDSHLSPTQHVKAFNSLRQLLLNLTISIQDNNNNNELNKFYKLQDNFEFNIASKLLEYLDKIILKLELIQHFNELELYKLNIIKLLSLLQGLLLLHSPSQKLFSRRKNLENLLKLLDLSRPSHLLSPLLPTTSTLPSPIFLPSSPSPSIPSTPSTPRSTSTSSSSFQSLDTSTQLLLTILDTLLCTLVDRPQNLRILETLGGLEKVVGVLKDRNVCQVVRIKAIEFLYYYLLPETSPNSTSPTPQSTSSSRTTSNSFMKSTTIPPPLPSTSTSSSSIRTFPTNISSSNFKNSHSPNSTSPLIDFIPQTPVKSRFSSSFGSNNLTSSPSISTSSSVPNSPSTNSGRTTRLEGRSRKHGPSLSLSGLILPSSPNLGLGPSRGENRSSSDYTSSYYSSSSLSSSSEAEVETFSRHKRTTSDISTPHKQVPLGPPPPPGSPFSQYKATHGRSRSSLSSGNYTRSNSLYPSNRKHSNTSSSDSTSTSSPSTSFYSTSTSNSSGSGSGSTSGSSKFSSISSSASTPLLSSLNCLPLPPSSPSSSSATTSGINNDRKELRIQDPDRTPTRLSSTSSNPPIPSSSSSSLPYFPSSPSTRSESISTSSHRRTKSKLSINSMSSFSLPSSPTGPSTPVRMSSTTVIPNSPALSSTSSSFSRVGAEGSKGGTGRGGESSSRGRRTELEKRELLRLVMPNVEALEARFKIMGLKEESV